jgi:hypothetical protein
VNIGKNPQFMQKSTRALSRIKARTSCIGISPKQPGQKKRGKVIALSREQNIFSTVTFTKNLLLLVTRSPNRHHHFGDPLRVESWPRVQYRGGHGPLRIGAHFLADHHREASGGAYPMKHILRLIAIHPRQLSPPLRANVQPPMMASQIHSARCPPWLCGKSASPFRNAGNAFREMVTFTFCTGPAQNTSKLSQLEQFAGRCIEIMSAISIMFPQFPQTNGRTSIRWFTPPSIRAARSRWASRHAHRGKTPPPTQAAYRSGCTATFHR